MVVVHGGLGRLTTINDDFWPGQYLTAGRRAGRAGHVGPGVDNASGRQYHGWQERHGPGLPGQLSGLSVSIATWPVRVRRAPNSFSGFRPGQKVRQTVQSAQTVHSAQPETAVSGRRRPRAVGWWTRSSWPAGA